LPIVGSGPLATQPPSSTAKQLATVKPRIRPIPLSSLPRR
jgi:hypothetical protein